jgi:hypothetical protein
MAEFDLSLHDKEHFLGQITLTVEYILGIELHGLQ